MHDGSICIFVCDSLRANRLRHRVDLVHLVSHHGAVRSVKSCIVAHGNIRWINLVNKHHGADGKLGLHRAREHSKRHVSKCTRNKRNDGKGHDEYKHQATKKRNKSFESARRHNN